MSNEHFPSVASRHRCTPSFINVNHEVPQPGVFWHKRSGVLLQFGQRISQEGFICTTCASSRHGRSITPQRRYVGSTMLWILCMTHIPANFGRCIIEKACIAVGFLPSTLKTLRAELSSVHSLAYWTMCLGKSPMREDNIPLGTELEIYRLCCIHLHPGDVRHVGCRTAS